MNALVIYDSTYGNTEQLARTIGAAIGERAAVTVRSFTDADTIPPEIDLIVVGGPTHAHGVDPTLKTFLDDLPAISVQQLAAASFDTRYRLPALITGSAARGIAKRLERKGARLVAEPESFFVKGSKGPLAEGEIARATAWGRQLVERANGAA